MSEVLKNTTIKRGTAGASLTQKLGNFWRPRIEFLKTFMVIWLWQTFTFTLLLLAYLLHNILVKVFSLRFIPEKLKKPALQTINSVFGKIVQSSTQQERTINRISLIDLAIKNMLFKRSRALITVGGMAIGIGIIVFLVSVGFGLQELVTSRVARLEELQQADVSVQPGSKEVINDATLAKFNDLEQLSAALPMIVSVARVEYQNSVSDMAVYGVTADYLKQSAVLPSRGQLFTSNELVTSATATQQTSMQAKDVTVYEEGDYELTPTAELPIEFSLPADDMVRVRAKTTTDSEVIGFTQNQYPKQKGWRVWGGDYPEAGNKKLQFEKKPYGPWIKSSFPIWLEAKCDDKAADCVDGKYVTAKTADGKQLISSGYVAASVVTVHSKLVTNDPMYATAKVAQEPIASESAELDLGAETATAGLASAADSGIVEVGAEWVEIASESASTETEVITKVSISDGAKKEAVVNRAMLQILGLPEDQAVGKKFAASFVVIGELAGKPGEKIESIPTEYLIVGVVPDEKNPYFYVPFVDLRQLGITQYSQVKIVAKSAENLSKLRKQIESMGFSTRSVADTVDQIDRLFSTARFVLGILGFVALSIAALGMFNTLTVSLLERTREVGLMKAMGMRSNEVRELFLTESLVMGFFGGVFGIIFGSVTSELLGLLLSVFSVSKGIGFIDVAYLPTSFVTFIFVLSLMVGVLTGIYPASRATKISALDALRYE